MNKWRLLLFSVFGLLQITTSDRNFIDGRSCEHSFRYSEPDTRISIYDLETRKSLETRPPTRAKELRSSFRHVINNREHLRRANVDHQTYERHRMKVSTNDPQMTQSREFSREGDFEYSRIKRDNTHRERSVKYGDREFRKDSRSEVESHHNNRQRVGNSGIRQDDGFEYRQRFARNFAEDRMSANRKSENNLQKLERRVLDTSRIAKRFENKNTIRQHLLNDETRKIKVRYQSERNLENDEVRNTRNERFVREYRNKEHSFIENRIRSNMRSRNNNIVLNRQQERRINKRGLIERNVRLNERSVSDVHLNYIRDTILSDKNNMKNNRQRVSERNLIMSRGIISELPYRYREEIRERERTQKNINENRIREDSSNTNREDLRRNRDLNFETQRDIYERAVEEDSATIRVTRRAAIMCDLRDDVRDINRENRFSQRTSQIRRRDTRLETSNMIERHIHNSRELEKSQERDRRNLKESRNIRMIENRDNGHFKVKADASLERRVINIHREERSRVHTDYRRERNFIRDDIRQHRQHERESSRMRNNSALASRRINVDRAMDNIVEQLRQTRLQNTQERRDIRRRDREESRARNISASRHYSVQNMVNEELQRIRSRSLEERSVRRQKRDTSVRSTVENSNNFRINNLEEIRQGNLYSRDNRDESRRLSIRVLSHMENREEHQSRSQPPVERLSIRQYYRNILRSRNANLPNRYATTDNRDNARDEVRSGDTENILNRYVRDTQARQNIKRDNRDGLRTRNVRVLSNMENSEEHQIRSRPSLERFSIRQNDRNVIRSRSTDLPNRYSTSNNRDNVRDEVRSGDIKYSLNRYSRVTQARQNIRRENRDESRIRSVRVLSDIKHREEHRSRSQPPLERLRIRQNDRNIFRSRSVDLPNRYATSKSRDNVREELRSGNIEKSLNNKRASTDTDRTRSIPSLKTFRINKNNEESRRTATDNTLRLTSTIDSARLSHTFISQNRRNDEGSRRIRSRSLTTERRTENRQVRMNRDRSLNERSSWIEHDDERRDTQRVHLIAAKRSTLFANNMRDITMTQKIKTASYIFEMKWQYIFYALQGIYICSLLLKMPQYQGKKQLSITSWLTPVNYMKID